MEEKAVPIQQPRIGFHYFPDTMHYRESDITRWLPELQSLGASWITLFAHDDFAIPEPFITSLIKANIKPIIHLHSSTLKPCKAANLKALLTAYANWGVQYIVFFDRPNQISSWSPTDWAQNKLVDRFLDLYLPCAEVALSLSLTPVLPPLEPGGSYWDTAFLRDLLLAIKRRGYAALLDHMALSANAKLGNRPLEWGAGGPERWPSTKPYYTPKGSQDQCGFHIFDWYLAISAAICERPIPLILFQVGCRVGDASDPQFPAVTPVNQTSRHLEIAQALAGSSNQQDIVPPQVISINFGPLWAAPGDSEAPYAWFQANGDKLPVVDSLKNWASSHNSVTIAAAATSAKGRFNPHPIAHYLLLNEEQWGKLNKNSPILRAFTQKYKPTIGFSLSEAALAHRVTIFGGPHIFPETIVDQLSAAGCTVERIQEDGTVIASNN